MSATTAATSIAVPVITNDMSKLEAALAYAAAGWYIGPEERGTKNPGSILGKDWQRRTSREPPVIASWFAGTDHGIFLHVGRSGAWVADVDNPDNLHPAIQQAITQHNPPYQSTRPNQPGRGHYIFLQPEGRILGNSLGNLARGWGEGRGLNGVIIVAPSEHEKPEGCYEWRRTGPVSVMPGYMASQLPDAVEAAEAATDEQVKAFLAQHTGHTRPDLLAVHCASYQKKAAAGESRHHTMTGPLAGAMKEAAAGLLNAKTAADALESVFLEAVAKPPVGPKQGKARTGAVARNEWAGLLSWAVAQGLAADSAATHERVNEKVPPPFTEVPFEPNGLTPNGGNHADDPKGALAALLTGLRTWQDLPDPTHVIVGLAAAATRKAEGEPCWVLQVAPPSSGKTENVRLLDNTADARLDEVTAGGLLSWTKGKTSRPTGVLARINATALVTFGDLSSLLATSDRGGRDQVFSLLRKAYDGHATRDIAPPAKVEDGHSQQLSWSGRLTVVACVSGAIDRYATHADQLGPRWVYIRIPERSTQAKRKAARLARRGDLASHRKQARETVASLLAGLPAKLPELPDDVADVIEDAALVTAWGRGAVPRNGYGRREIEGVPVVEEPMRLVQQLGTLARGVLALGLPAEAAADIARRVALDSMPAARRAVLQVLSTGEVLSTSACANRAGLDRKVARMALEELAAIDVMENDRENEETDDHAGVVHWALKGADGEVIADVLEAFRQTQGGWDETWVYTSPSPPIREGGQETTGGNPHFVPPPKQALMMENSMTGMPRRVQQRRSKGWRKPEGAISVAAEARKEKWGIWGGPRPVNPTRKEGGVTEQLTELPIGLTCPASSQSAA